MAYSPRRLIIQRMPTTRLPLLEGSKTPIWRRSYCAINEQKVKLIRIIGTGEFERIGDFDTNLRLNGSCTKGRKGSTIGASQPETGLSTPEANTGIPP
jgi:hypothetical protein